MSVPGSGQGKPPIPEGVRREHRRFLARQALVQAIAGAATSLVILALSARNYRRVVA